MFLRAEKNEQYVYSNYLIKDRAPELLDFKKHNHFNEQTTTGQSMTFSTWCSFHNPTGKVSFLSLFAKLREPFLKLVADNMLFINHDVKLFEIYIHENGTADVYCKYQQIIGSRLIATITNFNLPEEFYTLPNELPL